MKTIASHSNWGAFAFGALAWTLPGVAFAHDDHSGAASFTHGAMHPMSGLDHLVAMVAIGVLAALIGGRARWGIPFAFLAMMLLGAASAASVHFPFVEPGILASLVIVAGMFAARLRPSSAISATFLGAFGILHGYVHGAEMPASADGALYALGFTLTSAMLLGVGIAGALLARRVRPGVGAEQ